MEKEEEEEASEEEEEEEGKRNQLFSAEECADLDFKNNSPSNPRRRWRLSTATAAAPVYFGLLQNKIFFNF